MQIWKRKNDTRTTGGGRDGGRDGGRGGKIGKYSELGLGIPAWLLSTAGFGIMLGGVAAMQSECGNSNVIQVMGTVNYLSPVGCDRFFSFDWFITFWHFFVWFLVAIFLFTRLVSLSRALLTSFLAIAAVLLMFMANTWYRVNGVDPPPPFPELSDKFKDRARVALAGAIIAAVADLFLIMILGVEYEKGEEGEEEEGTMPSGGYRTTTVPETTAAPVETTATHV